MCLDADDYCPYEVPDAQPTKKVEPQGRIWKCLACGKTWRSTTWLDDLMKISNMDIYCKKCQGELEEVIDV
jgi:transcription elongation factor Elf1